MKARVAKVKIQVSIRNVENVPMHTGTYVFIGRFRMVVLSRILRRSTCFEFKFLRAWPCWFAVYL